MLCIAFISPAAAWLAILRILSYKERKQFWKLAGSQAAFIAFISGL